MKKFLRNNKGIFFFISILLFIWRALLFLIEIFSLVIPQYSKFLGPIAWANFDGVHYLGIAQHGYQIYQQAFFPLFPLLINFFSLFFNEDYVLSGLFVVYFSLILALIFFYKLVSLDFDKNTARWAVVFLLFFPTAFFLSSIYTESLFLLLTFSSFFFIRKKRFVLASILIGLASATKIIGIFLLFPLLMEFYLLRIKKIKNLKSHLFNFVSILLTGSSGLILYMIYLLNTYKDPFLFINTQPSFEAGRSVEKIILLPQVIFRYVKILILTEPLSHNFLIALLEISVFLFFFSLFILSWKRIRASYLLFGFLSIIIPTFSGTFLSEPRFVLTAFPAFILFASVREIKYKVLLLGIFTILLSLLTAFFLRGYFIA